MRDIDPRQLEAVRGQLAQFVPVDAHPYASFDCPPVYTLNATPPPAICQAISKVAARLQQDFPEHYFYPQPQYHVTLQPVPASVDPALLIHEWVSKIAGQNFTAHAYGVGVNPYGVAVPVYPKKSIVPLRKSLWQTFGKALDYTEHHAIWEELLWVTFIRFRAQPSEALLAALRSLQDYDFGTFELREFELWQNSSKVRDPAKSQLLHVFTS